MKALYQSYRRWLWLGRVLECLAAAWAIAVLMRRADHV